MLKITRQTDSQLILENRPWILGGLFSVGMIGSAGIALWHLLRGDLNGLWILLGIPFFAIFFAAFVRRNQIVLHRPQGFVEIRRRSVLGYSAIRLDLAEVTRAIVETSRSTDSDTHRAVLVVDKGQAKGTYPLTVVYSSGQGAARAARAINDWLGSQQG